MRPHRQDARSTPWRRTTAGLALALLSAPCPTQRVAAPPPAPREFRAAWVATVANIDWPSRKGLPTAAQKAELEKILDCARELRLNALIFQVRPACDALYPSKLEPWAEWLTGSQGRAPAPFWDPLAFAVAGAHERGIELHAWFNPFRARHAGARSEASKDHVQVRSSAWVVRYGQQLWLDPGVPAAAEHSLAVILDVVDRYDVDGVHIDDYFYPYPVRGQAFPDDRSYRRYRARGGALGRADWRRRNVDSFVERLYAKVKRRKRWVKVGISPFGIARPGVPRGIEAGIDQFDELYADPRKWLASGWCDYLAPQLYWPISQKPQSYPKLLGWWADQNPKRRHLWIGNSASRAATAGSPWSAIELADQIALTRAEAGATGNILFSMRVLRDDVRGVARALRTGPYRTPALIPASPWLDRSPPARPSLALSEDDSGWLAVRWKVDADARWRCIHVLSPDRWRLLQIVSGSSRGFRFTDDELARLQARAIAVSAVDRCGNEGPAAIATLR